MQRESFNDVIIIHYINTEKLLHHIRFSSATNERTITGWHDAFVDATTSSIEKGD